MQYSTLRQANAEGLERDRLGQNIFGNSRSFRTTGPRRHGGDDDDDGGDDGDDDDGDDDIGVQWEFS